MRAEPRHGRRRVRGRLLLRPHDDGRLRRDVHRVLHARRHRRHHIHVARLRLARRQVANHRAVLLLDQPAGVEHLDLVQRVVPVLVVAVGELGCCRALRDHHFLGDVPSRRAWRCRYSNTPGIGNVTTGFPAASHDTDVLPTFVAPSASTVPGFAPNVHVFMVPANADFGAPCGLAQMRMSRSCTAAGIAATLPFVPAISAPGVSSFRRVLPADHLDVRVGSPRSRACRCN